MADDTATAFEFQVLPNQGVKVIFEFTGQREFEQHLTPSNGPVIKKGNRIGATEYNPGINTTGKIINYQISGWTKEVSDGNHNWLICWGQRTLQENTIKIGWDDGGFGGPPYADAYATIEFYN